MRRNGRRLSSDYLEETEELNETYEEFDTGTDLEATDEVYDETEEIPERKSVWVKIGRVALIVLVLIALFFVSMKVTEIFLDRNQEPDYSSDAPAYSDSDFTDDENIPVIDEDAEYEEKADTEELKEYKEEDVETEKKPSSSQEEPSAEKPTQTEKPAESEKPAQTEKPLTPETPSTPSKPIITPGNPAA